ncbi:5-oxoprolinase subunit PxpB [Priestia megaterium]|nr:5-oxoprolinase subunit PxpB [Priestia megaterium]
MHDTYTIYPLGDSGLVVSFGDEIQLSVHEQVQKLTKLLEAEPFEGMIEYVPAFTTVTIYYHPWIVGDKGKHDPYQVVKERVESLLKHDRKEVVAESRLIDIPVCYGGEYGPDLIEVAKHNSLTEQEVIHIHTSKEYLVYMIGFAPGFPYLGGMSEKIAAPRKETPRSAIPKGSVGIAGKQTGIYPIETPGGWQLIGRTPLALFTPNAASPSLLRAGDRIRFVEITQEEYEARKEKVYEY